MGLLLEVELDNGAVAEYHTIVMTNVNWLSQEFVFDVASYVSKDHRDKSPMRPLHSQRYSCNGEDFTLVKGEDPVGPAYSILKADANFEGAKDA